jgi:L-threonylcarbamoyladenylate synthase
MLVLNSLNDEKVAKSLVNGAVVVMPTDTVYDLVCSAKSTNAVERLYQTKHREHKPGTVIAANIDQLVDLGVKRRYVKAVEEYWPNPLSVVIPVGPELDYVTQGVVGLAVCIPKDPAIRDLLLKTGPLLTTSANMPGEPVSGTIDNAIAYFGDAVDLYVDGGDLSGNLPSTLIRIVDDAVEVLRQGAVKINED